MAALGTKRPASRPGSQALSYFVYTTLAVSTVAPLLWIICLSFRTRAEFDVDPFGLPSTLAFTNYAAVFNNDAVPGFLLNSILAVGGALAIVLVSATLAAYAMARIPFRGSSILFLMFLSGDSIPLVVIIVPLFVLVQMIGLGGSLLAVVFSYAAMSMGVSIYVLRGFFRSISTEIEEAARLDGCRLPQVIWHVILPMARPGLLVVGITNFIAFWNEYFLATVLVSGQSSFTLPAGLAATFVSKHETNWPVMAAAVVLMMIPVLTVFLVFEDQIVNGWTVAPR